MWLLLSSNSVTIVHLHLKCHCMVLVTLCDCTHLAFSDLRYILQQNNFLNISKISFPLENFHILCRSVLILKTMKKKLKSEHSLFHTFYQETNFFARIAFRQSNTAVCWIFPLNFSCTSWPYQQAGLLRLQRWVGLSYLNGLIAKWIL